MNMMKRVLLLGLLMGLMMVAAACQDQDEQMTPVADEAIATPSPAPTRAEATGVKILAEGQLVAVNPVLPLGFEVSGRVLTMSVKVGDTVTAGTIIATLSDAALQDSVTSAGLQVQQAEISLLQAQASLEALLTWEPDEYAVAVAEANLVAATAAYDQAVAQDAAAGNSLTSANVSVDQAERNLADAQEAYDTAYDPAREWELNDPFRGPALEREREGASRNLQFAQENLQVARAQYNLAAAGLNNDSALNAEASVAQAQQALDQATRGPSEADLASAEIQVEQAEIALAQSQFSLTQAQNNLEKVHLIAPWTGTILAVDVSAGAVVGAGTPVVTLLDTSSIQFHTSNLSERDLAQVASGQVAEIVLKAYSTETVMGTVVGVAPQATGVLGDAALFTVMIRLDEADLILRPGMTGRVEIMDEQ